MINIKLPFWLSATENEKLMVAAQVWWQRVEGWLQWPLDQMDPLTCELAILYLLAWQRDIERFTNEDEALYRLRVKYALINAQDAGSKAGFIAIFERLGIGYVEIEERTDPVDWDIVLLLLSDSQVANNSALIDQIIAKYGRTCRRYQLTVITPIPVAVEARLTGHIWSLDTAIQKIEPYLADATVENRETGNSWDLDIASL